MFHLHSVDFVYPHQNLEFPKDSQTSEREQDDSSVFAGGPGLSFISLSPLSRLPGSSGIEGQ